MTRRKALPIFGVIKLQADDAPSSRRQWVGARTKVNLLMYTTRARSSFPLERTPVTVFTANLTVDGGDGVILMETC